MATESAGDSEHVVSLSPSLDEWLDERANALGIDRTVLLDQLLETYKSAVEFDDRNFEQVREKSRSRADDRRLEELETEVTNDVEDIRSRVLQLRDSVDDLGDAIEDPASVNHSHEEIRDLSVRVEAVSETVATVEDELESFENTFEAFSPRVDSIDDRLDVVESRLDRLARAVLAQTQQAKTTQSAAAALADIRREANRIGTTNAGCAGCGNTVHLGLLSEPVCPHCDSRLLGLELPQSVLPWFDRPHLTVGADPAVVDDE